MRKAVAMTAFVTLLLMTIATLTAITTAQATGSYIPQPDLLMVQQYNQTELLLLDRQTLQGMVIHTYFHLI